MGPNVGKIYYKNRICCSDKNRMGRIRLCWVLIKIWNALKILGFRVNIKCAYWNRIGIAEWQNRYFTYLWTKARCRILSARRRSHSKNNNGLKIQLWCIRMNSWLKISKESACPNPISISKHFICAFWSRNSSNN